MKSWVNNLKEIKAVQWESAKWIKTWIKMLIWDLQITHWNLWSCSRNQYLNSKVNKSNLKKHRRHAPFELAIKEWERVPTPKKSPTVAILRWCGVVLLRLLEWNLVGVALERWRFQLKDLIRKVAQVQSKFRLGKPKKVIQLAIKANPPSATQAWRQKDEGFHS